MSNGIAEIVLGEIVENENVLLERGYILIDDEKQNMLSNNIEELLEKTGITEVDLSAITGVTRQNLNMIIQNRVKPSVDFALKASRIFKKPVEEIFSLNDGAWFDKITGFKDTSIFLQTNNNKVIGKSERDANLKENKAEYWNSATNELLTKEQYQALLKNEIAEHQDELMDELERRNPEMTRNERLSTAQQQLREKFYAKHPKLYKKIGIPIDPEKMLLERKAMREDKARRK